MKLKSLRIENFRAFADETINFDNYTCFVGSNGSGKSTVLTALNIFFRNTASAATDLVNLQDEDFHIKDTSKPVKITLTFQDLSSDAKDQLKAYVRQNQLVVSAVATWNPDSARADVKQVGSRFVMQDFSPFFEAQENKAKAEALRAIFTSIAEKYPKLGKAGTIEAMRTSLRELEEQNPQLCVLVEAETQFYGWARGDNLLRRFVQWVYMPAVKDPTTEQTEGKNTALGALLERTIRSKVNFDDPISTLRAEAAKKYKDLLKGQQGVLDDLTKSLTQKLRSWAHDSVNVSLLWHYDDQKSISIATPLARIFAGEHEFLGEIGRLGHGLQRAFLVSILQELAESGDEGSAHLLLGFEEPELYQHPPQARHMAGLLEALSTKNTQPIITTHSPYFVSGRGFENVRMVRHDSKSKSSIVGQATHDQLAKLLGAALGEAPRSPSAMMASVEQVMQPSQNELFFCRLPVIVEGIEDVSFVTTYLHLLKRWADFRKLGCHFIISDGKTNISRPLAIANCLATPSFVMFDADGNKKTDNNKRDNTCILKLLNDSSSPFPDKVFFGERCVVWPANLKASIIEEIGQAAWDAADAAVRKAYKYDGESQKNSVVITAILEELWKNGAQSKLLTKACDSILSYATNSAKA